MSVEEADPYGVDCDPHQHVERTMHQHAAQAVLDAALLPNISLSLEPCGCGCGGAGSTCNVDFGDAETAPAPLEADRER